MRSARCAGAPIISLYKKTSTNKGASTAAREYLMSRSTTFPRSSRDDIRPSSRGRWGVRLRTGRIGARAGDEADYQLSQREDYMRSRSAGDDDQRGNHQHPR